MQEAAERAENEVQKRRQEDLKRMAREQVLVDKWASERYSDLSDSPKSRKNLQMSNRKLQK